jgi:protein involved in temperature-dependent protein secretion
VIVKTGPSFKGMELGELLTPVLTPGAWEDEEDTVRLGRVTEWVRLESGAEVPMGQKMIVADDTEYPLLEIREILIDPKLA